MSEPKHLLGSPGGRELELWLYKNGSRLFTELVLPNNLFLAWLVENLQITPLLQALGGVSPARAPLGAGTPTLLVEPADGRSPALRGGGTSACVSVGLASHQPPLPFPLLYL